jgi:hypothetical protein
MYYRRGYEVRRGETSLKIILTFLNYIILYKQQVFYLISDVSPQISKTMRITMLEFDNGPGVKWGFFEGGFCVTSIFA